MVRKTRKQKAGKLVGHGSFGCGFVPSLRCKGEDATPPDTLFSKLMLKGEAEKEMKLVEDIALVDPEMRYSIYSRPADVCNLNPENLVLHKNDMEECPILVGLAAKNTSKPFLNSITQHQNNLTLLRAPAAKKDLFAVIDEYITDTNPNKYTILPFVFRSIRNLFEGLVHYHGQGFYHMDVKSENIVVNYDADMPSVAKFIDFGLSASSRKIETVGVEAVLRQYMRINKVYPIELYFSNFPKEIVRSINRSYLTHHINVFYDTLADGSFPYSIFINSSRYPRIDDTVLQSLLIHPKDPNDKKIYFVHSDLYGLGLTLYSMMEYMGCMIFQGSFQRTSSAIAIPEEEQKKLDKFLMNLYEKVISKLVSISLKDRFNSAEEALLAYDKCLTYLN
jgi:serine/threonine protein kinase